MTGSARNASGVLLLVVAAASWGVWRDLARSRDERSASAERVAALGEEIGSLRAELAREVARRALLEQRVARLDTAADVAVPSAAAGASATSDAPEAPDSATALGAESPPHAVAPAIPTLDEQRLLAAGFAERDIERYRERLDQIALDQLYLRDQAAREGWLGTPRFAQEQRRLASASDGLREEFGESLYDWALFASGQPNRVAVADVIAGSAADSVGLAPGDVILRYDERVVLDAGQLRDATIAGAAGGQVSLEVMHDGEPLRVFVPRGPLGVRLAPALLEPPPAG